MKGLTIRHAQPKDIPFLNAIYNQAVKLNFSTADTEPIALQYHLEWFNNHKQENNPILVAELDGIITGWNSLSYYRNGRSRLLQLRETSYYIAEEYRGKGIASELLKAIINDCPIYNISKLITFIIDQNNASIRLMKKFSFELWGRLPGAVAVNNKDYDHLIFGKTLEI